MAVTIERSKNENLCELKRSKHDWLALLVTIAFAATFFPRTAESESSSPPTPASVRIAQLNVCGAGQWFVIISHDGCETHIGVSPNPNWIGYINADDYSRWRGRQVTVDSLLQNRHLIALGEGKLASEISKNTGNGAAASSSAAHCLPQLPELSHRRTSPPIQIPGCDGAMVNHDPWTQVSQCSPRSSLGTIVRLLIADHLEVPIQRVSLRSDIIKDLGADDLDTVELVMLFEQTFSIEIPDDDAERIVTVQDMVNYIASKICR